jgi:cathepsin L
MDDAFQFIISNGGICSESSYPYTASGPNTCQTSCASVAKISSYQDVASGDETQLQAAVAIGPVSVAIEADQQVFQLYSSGVLTDSGCGTQLDHGVLVVGYGTDASSGPFWKVKNSWGASWGENGYIRIARGTNECGVAQQPSYPVIGSSKKANVFRF